MYCVTFLCVNKEDESPEDLDFIITNTGNLTFSVSVTTVK